MVAMENIRVELDERVAELRANDRLLEAQRLSQRTMFDLEMIAELGYCNGIENYSRHSQRTPAGRAAADADRLFSEGLPAGHRRVASDHSAGARACGAATARARRRWSSTASACRARSTTGRCQFDEFEGKLDQILYVSATPGPYRDGEDRRTVRGAGHPSDGTARSGDHHPSGEGAGRRSDRRDQGAHRRRASA